MERRKFDKKLFDSLQSCTNVFRDNDESNRKRYCALGKLGAACGVIDDNTLDRNVGKSMCWFLAELCISDRKVQEIAVTNNSGDFAKADQMVLDYVMSYTEAFEVVNA